MSPEVEPVDTLIGRKFGNYQLERLLGRGGMGSVYVALHPTLGKRVAIKVLRSGIEDRRAVSRLIDEARASNAIGNEHIVEIFDCGETPDGITYIAMELLHGETLEELLLRERRLPARRAIAIARQVCSALAGAHQRGIIHRDLKPQNIFLVRVEGEERAKVLDFGAAKLLDAFSRATPATSTGTLVGTPYYMAPEQAQCKTLDGRTDLFALGVILYRGLTGELPFPGETVTHVLSRLLTETPRPLSEVAPAAAVPPALERLVLRALARDPTDRPPDMETFERELAACLLDLPADGTASAATIAAPPTPSPVTPESSPAVPPRAGRPTSAAASSAGPVVASAVRTIEVKVSHRMLLVRLFLYPTLVAIFLFGYFLLVGRQIGDRRLSHEVIGVGVAALVVAYLLELGYRFAGRRSRTPVGLHYALITAFVLVATYALQLNGTLTSYMAMFYAMLITFSRVRLGRAAARYATGLSLACVLGVALLEQAGVIGYARMLNPAAIPPLVNARAYASVIIAGTVAFLLLAHIGANMLVRGLESREEALAEVGRGLEGQVQEKIAVLQRREQLRHFLPSQLVEGVVSGAYPARVASRRQKLTVVACVLHDFFGRTATLEPEDQAQLLNELYAGILDTAQRFDALVQGLTRAEATLVFGASGAQSDREAAQTAVRAALALRHLLADRDVAWRARGAGAIEPHLAVHTAYAALGNFGSEGRLVFGAVGPALAVVHQAALASPPGTVVVTQAVRLLCGESVNVEQSGQVVAPGASEPVTLHRVVA